MEFRNASETFRFISTSSSIETQEGALFQFDFGSRDSKMNLKFRFLV